MQLTDMHVQPAKLAYVSQPPDREQRIWSQELRQHIWILFRWLSLRVTLASSLIGTDAFQEADITGITMPITKHSYLVRDVKDLPRIIHEAFHIANTGRKGPVLIDIPKDVSAHKTMFKPVTELLIFAVTIQRFRPNKLQVDKLIKAIEEAERPVILAGGGVVYCEMHPKN